MELRATPNTKRQEAPAHIPSSELMRAAHETFSRLEHLQNNKDPNHQARIVGALQKAVDKLRTSTERLTEAFLEKYDISVQDGSVKFTIPKGASVLDLLKEAQMISLIGRGAVAVYPPRLANWSTLPEFTTKRGGDYSCEVNPTVSGTEFKSRKEQVAHLKEQGLRIATAWETAAAHAAFTVLTGEPLADLFDGNIIRVKGTKLYYGNGGLSEMDESDYVNNCSYKNVRMAAARKV